MFEVPYQLDAAMYVLRISLGNPTFAPFSLFFLGGGGWLVG